ncbi:ferritin-like domain-containing protein [Tahibacter harae]|uniref:Ferritin-like domain-containing protein n=1 Tax=Tahibacter harae TaxID=2963937 RepID=A0ABT1QTR1_9GAMM|nr:ferritin-like domain-containing protein [Tahibacter harae]MCQ4165663.1 ferritin-like domain-containing protein [Tahibacter harae]
MSLLKPAARPLRSTDFAWSQLLPAGYDAALLHILRTTALVESRADQYADYLRAVFAARGSEWRAAIDGWNREEREHGVVLRRLCEAADGEFGFDAALKAYLDGVDYHACDGISVRGSIAGELVARCVVEALASTFYRVLRDRCADPLGRAVLHALSQDEARHYGMFHAMLQAERARTPLSLWQRLRVGLGRMLELSDDQIMFASWLVDADSAPRYACHAAARRYNADLYPHYRFAHLHYAARLLCPALFGLRHDGLSRVFAAGLWLGVRARALLSALRPPRREMQEAAWRDRLRMP